MEIICGIIGFALGLAFAHILIFLIGLGEQTNATRTPKR